MSSSQRTLGSILTFALAGQKKAKSKIKMDPSVRWDDDREFHYDVGIAV